MRIHFTTRQDGPERLVTEPEIVFETQDGPLAGTKLTGFSIWSGADGGLYVTFPGRPFAAGGERRFYDYLRASDASVDTLKRVKAWILDEYRKSQQAVA